MIDKLAGFDSALRCAYIPVAAHRLNSCSTSVRFTHRASIHRLVVFNSHPLCLFRV